MIDDDDELHLEPWQREYLIRAADTMAKGGKIIINLPRQYGTRLRTTLLRGS